MLGSAVPETARVALSQAGIGCSEVTVVAASVRRVGRLIFPLRRQDATENNGIEQKMKTLTKQWVKRVGRVKLLRVYERLGESEQALIDYFRFKL